MPTRTESGTSPGRLTVRAELSLPLDQPATSTAAAAAAPARRPRASTAVCTATAAGPQAHSQPVQLTSMPAGRTLASCSGDKTVRLWECGEAASGWSCKVVLECTHTKTIRSVNWSPGGASLATASFDGATAIWAKAGARWEQVRRGRPRMPARHTCSGWFAFGLRPVQAFSHPRARTVC